MPAVVLAVLHLVERRPRAILRMLAPVNLFVFLALVLPWFVALIVQHPEFLHYGLVEETMRRYLTATLRRSEPVYYYAPILLLVFYPWSALLPEAAVAAWRSRARWTQADRFLIVWAVVVVFFSSSQSKRPGYILPGIVALAVLTARLFDYALARPESRAARLILRASSGSRILSTVAAGALSLNLGGRDRLQSLLGVESNEFGRLQPDAGLLVACPGHGGRRVCGPALARCAAGARRVRPSRGPLPIGRLRHRRPVRGGELGARAGASDLAAAARRDRRLPRVLRGRSAVLRRPARDLHHPARPGRADQQLRPLPAGARRELAPRPGPAGRPGAVAGEQTVPVYVLAKDHARSLLEEIARSRGVSVMELRPGWWGALVPPPPRP